MTERPQILQEREKTHGDFKVTAQYAQELKNMFHLACKNKPRSIRQMEALDMIATKLARILAGNIQEKDHWKDLAGYAKLGAEACE